MGIGGGLLRKRDFRLFRIGETVNQLGSATALIGVPLLAVLYLRVSTLEVGALAGGALGTWLGPRDALRVVLSILAASGTLLLRPSLVSRRDLPASSAPCEVPIPRPDVPASVRRRGHRAG
jgi:hypothetical protein